MQEWNIIRSHRSLLRPQFTDIIRKSTIFLIRHSLPKGCSLRAGGLGVISPYDSQFLIFTHIVRHDSCSCAIGKCGIYSSEARGTWLVTTYPPTQLVVKCVQSVVAVWGLFLPPPRLCTSMQVGRTHLTNPGDLSGLGQNLLWRTCASCSGRVGSRVCPSSCWCWACAVVQVSLPGKKICTTF